MTTVGTTWANELRGPRRSFLLWLAAVLAAANGLHAANARGCMTVDRSLALRGAREVSVEVQGQMEGAVRGFSLALGHDAARLELVRVEVGPLFGDAELVSHNESNAAGASGAPHGEIFVLLDFQEPFDRPPVDLASGAVLCRFVYDVRDDALEGKAALHLGNREYGLPDREVSSIFVSDRSLEVYPELVDGHLEVFTGPALISIDPSRGSLEGGRSVRAYGVGLSDEPGSRIFVGAAEALIIATVRDVEITFVSPESFVSGKLGVRYEGRLGTAELPGAFEYAASAFQRGDCDQDGQINLTDAIFTLRYLFEGGQAPPCADACDVDDDGRVRITDSIVSLNYLFRGGGMPPEPFAAPGLDPTRDSIPCDL